MTSQALLRSLRVAHCGPLPTLFCHHMNPHHHYYSPQVCLTSPTFFAPRSLFATTFGSQWTPGDIVDHNDDHDDEATHDSSNRSTIESSSTTTTTTTKRPPNAFAMFLSEYLRKVPEQTNSMDAQEESSSTEFSQNSAIVQPRTLFQQAGERWRSLSEPDRDHYKRLAHQALADYHRRQEKKVAKKQSSRPDHQSSTRLIEQTLRELHYPKRACASPYLFYLSAERRRRRAVQVDTEDTEDTGSGSGSEVNTEGKVGNLTQHFAARWRAMSAEERRPFVEQARADRERYVRELDHWKHEMAKPENEPQLRRLEELAALEQREKAMSQSSKDGNKKTKKAKKTKAAKENTVQSKVEEAEAEEEAEEEEAFYRELVHQKHMT